MMISRAGWRRRLAWAGVVLLTGLLAADAGARGRFGGGGGGGGGRGGGGGHYGGGGGGGFGGGGFHQGGQAGSHGSFNRHSQGGSYGGRQGASRGDRQGSRSDPRRSQGGSYGERQGASRGDRQGGRSDRQPQDQRGQRQDQRSDRASDAQDSRSDRASDAQDSRNQARDDRQQHQEGLQDSRQNAIDNRQDDRQDFYEENRWGWGYGGPGTYGAGGLFAGLIIGAAIASIPQDSQTVYVQDTKYYYSSGTYYQDAPSGDGYVVAQAPTGAEVQSLPDATSNVKSGSGETYQYVNGTYYDEKPADTPDAAPSYEVVDAPLGAMVPDLPEDAKQQKVGDDTYFEYADTWYKPFYSGSDVVYQVIDKPAGA